jgi:hypothetical protein
MAGRHTVLPDRTLYTDRLACGPQSGVECHPLDHRPSTDPSAASFGQHLVVDKTGPCPYLDREQSLIYLVDLEYLAFQPANPLRAPS